MYPESPVPRPTKRGNRFFFANRPPSVMKLSLTPTFLALSLVACQSPAPVASSPWDGAASSPEAGDGAADYTFVFLETGPARDLPEDVLSDAFAGHFENMGRLAEDGTLLLAGPFFEPKADPAHRGLFVFDVADPAEARRLVATDPAVQAGALKGSVYGFRTTAPMRDFLDHYRTAAAELGTEPGMLAYVLVATRRADLARRTIENRPGLVIFHGRFDGDREGEWLLCLNARSKEEAHAELEPGDWTFLPWYSTETHVRALGDR